MALEARFYFGSQLNVSTGDKVIIAVVDDIDFFVTSFCMFFGLCTLFYKLCKLFITYRGGTMVSNGGSMYVCVNVCVFVNVCVCVCVCVFVCQYECVCGKVIERKQRSWRAKKMLVVILFAVALFISARHHAKVALEARCLQKN